MKGQEMTMTTLPWQEQALGLAVKMPVSHTGVPGLIPSSCSCLQSPDKATFGVVVMAQVFEFLLPVGDLE